MREMQFGLAAEADGLLLMTNEAPDQVLTAQAAMELRAVKTCHVIFQDLTRPDHHGYGPHG